MTGAPEDAGAAPARAEGRGRVRRCLIQPLAGLGPQRVPARRGTRLASPAEHAAMLERLEGRLAHMTEPGLAGLAELVLRTVSRPGQQSHWPAPGIVEGWGLAMEPPPPEASDYLPSLLRSLMGEEAREGGWHVELLRHARKAGPPPQAYRRAQLVEVARDNALTLERVRGRIEAGADWPGDRAWLDQYQADRRLAEALVAEGIARRRARAAKPGGEGA